MVGGGELRTFHLLPCMADFRLFVPSQNVMQYFKIDSFTFMFFQSLQIP